MSIDSLYFQRLSAEELNRFLGELDRAVEDHSAWSQRLNRTLIFRDGADPSDLADAPHTHCRFGRWYHGVDAQQMSALPGFSEIGPVHERMHAVAAELIHDALGRHTVSPERYDALIELSSRLRELVSQVRSGVKANLQIVTTLMGNVFEKSTEGVLITDAAGRIISINEAFTRVTGYEADEVLGKTPNILYSGRQDEAFYKTMWDSLLTSGQWQGEIWNRRKNGQIYPECLSIVAVRTEGEISHFLGVFTDVSNEKENEERLYHLAHYDQVTELPNRILFQDRLRQALAHARRDSGQVAVMFLDLDGFKEVNDRLGHRDGDELLRQVAGRLSGALREADTVARFGGDEFTVVLSQLEDPAAAEAVAEKLLAAIEPPYQLPHGDARISASIGVAIFPQHAREPDSLVKYADLAMYRAKQAGKGRHCLYQPSKAGDPL